jgi:hypothetical protein
MPEELSLDALRDWARRHPWKSAILALGGIGLVVTLWEGCSCACGTLTRMVRESKREEAARDSLADARSLVIQLESIPKSQGAVAQNLLADLDRQLNLVKLRDPAVERTEDYQKLRARLEELRAKFADSLPQPEEGATR